MNRQGHENTNFFIGTEVERTPAFGKRTLFVVGWQPITEIVRLLAENNSDQSRRIEHIFLVPITVFILPTDWSGNAGKA